MGGTFYHDYINLTAFDVIIFRSFTGIHLIAYLCLNSY